MLKPGSCGVGLCKSMKVEFAIIALLSLISIPGFLGCLGRVVRSHTSDRVHAATHDWCKPVAPVFWQSGLASARVDVGQEFRLG
jgi:hypothetical protein